MVPAAQALGLGVLPWSPLGRGVLTGKYRSGTPSDSRGATEHFGRFVGVYLDDRGRGFVEGVARAADGLGWTLVVNPENPTYYVLKNLPITYQQDNLEVTVCIYKTGEKVSCFCQEPKDEYAVASIKRR